MVVALAACRTPAPRAPASCAGAGWDTIAADTEGADRAPAPTHDERAAQLVRTIRDVQIIGVDAVLAATLARVVQTRPGQVLHEAPLSDDVRRLWALGIADDVRVELAGDRVAFAVTPRPTIGEVVIPARDPAALGRFALLPGAPYDPARLARMAASVRTGYVRDGHLDARLDLVRRARRDGRVDVCVLATPGPEVRIRSVTFPGRRRISEAQLLARLHGAKTHLNRPGGFYDEAALAFDRAFLIDTYFEAGMIDVAIGTPRVQRDGSALDLAIPIDEGDVFTVGTVTITGGPRVPVAIGYGEVFQRSRVLAARDALADATHTAVDFTPHIDRAHLRVDLTFTLTWRFPWDALRLWLSSWP